MTLGEVEEGLEVREKPDLTKITLDGDDLPEELKGKTAADALAIAKSAGAALRISEERRLQLEREAAARAAAIQPPPAPAPVVEEEKELTKEEYDTLYQRDPVAAIEYKNGLSEKRIMANLEKRLGGLVSGASSAAEQAARQKYADEFELFGDQIKATIDRLPSKEPMSQPKAWDDLMSYIRGQPDNFDKLVEHRASKGRKRAEDEARERERSSAGPGRVATVRSPAPASGGDAGLDDTEKEIARVQGISEADYAKWKRTR